MRLARADQFGRDVKQELVDEVRRDQRRIQARTAFDMQLVDATLRQVREHGMEVDVPIRRGAFDHLDATLAQRVDGGGGASAVDQRRSRRVEQP